MAGPLGALLPDPSAYATSHLGRVLDSWLRCGADLAVELHDGIAPMVDAARVFADAHRAARAAWVSCLPGGDEFRVAMAADRDALVAGGPVPGALVGLLGERDARWAAAAAHAAAEGPFWVRLWDEHKGARLSCARAARAEHQRARDEIEALLAQAWNRRGSADGLDAWLRHRVARQRRDAAGRLATWLEGDGRELLPDKGASLPHGLSETGLGLVYALRHEVDGWRPPPGTPIPSWTPPGWEPPNAPTPSPEFYAASQRY